MCNSESVIKFNNNNNKYIIRAHLGTYVETDVRISVASFLLRVVSIVDVERPVIHRAMWLPLQPTQVIIIIIIIIIIKYLYWSSQRCERNDCFVYRIVAGT